MPPGTVVSVPGAPPPNIRVITYGPEAHDEHAVGRPSNLRPPAADGPIVTWIDIVGEADSQTFSRLEQAFGLHPLALEDAANLHQRPKFEHYGDTNFIVLQMPSLRPGLDLEQVSVFFAERFVITVQEKPGDCFEGLRTRIRTNKGRVRRRGAGYLAYAILDAVVETFYPIVEHYSDRLEELEGRILSGTTEGVVEEIHEIRHDLHALRRAIAPTREVLSAVARDDGTAENDTHVFLRDCHDHAVQLLDTLDMSRDFASSLMDLHLSNLSTRMNEIMKVLTIIATIFIPLGFIAGVYGMNFDVEASRWNMPELKWSYGYLFALSLMAMTAFGLVLWFRTRGWIGKAVEHDRRR